MAWQVEFRAGVHLPQIAWWLDAHFPQRRCFVSHAHADHLARHGEILCSAGTSRLMRARMPGERTEHVLPFGQTEPLTPDSHVTLHPAGHIFGSAQSLIVHERHGALLYTGDFKLRPGRSAERCVTPRADVLIMETTFGRPQYVFPPTEDVLRDIAGFCHDCLDDGETPVLFGYSLGKSQELLCGLAAAGLPAMLHPQTLRLTRIYEELGVTFPTYRGFDAQELAGHVVICPPQSGSSAFLRQIPRRRTAVITGWAMDPGAIYRYQCDAAFPLSDHADYPDLLRFVDAVNRNACSRSTVSHRISPGPCANAVSRRGRSARTTSWNWPASHPAGPAWKRPRLRPIRRSPPCRPRLRRPRPTPSAASPPPPSR